MIPCQRHLFDLPREVAYFNCAYMSPLLIRSLEAGRAGLALKARPWQITPSDFFATPDAARAAFARIIGCAARDVALVPAASYGIAAAAANLTPEPGQRILLPADQFPSNVYPWRRRAAETGADIVTVDAADGDLTAALLAAIDDRTAIVACPHCRWTDGALIDLVAIGNAVRQVGAALVLDLTQSAGALPLDLAAVDPDYLVAAAYKWLLGPYSTGFLYVAPRRQDGRPIEEHWLGRQGSEDFAGLVAYRDGYRPGAARFDMGEAPNFSLLPAATVALEQIAEWGIARIAATLSAGTEAIARRAAALGLRASDPRLRAGHFLGLALPDGTRPDLVARLAAEDVHVSVRGGSLRITPHLYNDAADADRLIEALARLL
jgi:selenocysteine lyase/cysteine desulfurase